MVVVDMDAHEFVFMCGTIASHHDTALAHAMLHAVAVWVDARGSSQGRGRAREPRGGCMTG